MALTEGIEEIEAAKKSEPVRAKMYSGRKLTRTPLATDATPIDE